MIVPYILTLHLPDEAKILDEIFTDLRELPEKANDFSEVHSERVASLVGKILETNYANKDYAKIWNDVTKDDEEKHEKPEEPEEKSGDQDDLKEPSGKDSKIPDQVFCP